MISPKVANTLQGSLAVAFCSSTKRHLQGPSNTIHIEIKKSRPLIGQAFVDTSSYVASCHKAHWRCLWSKNIDLFPDSPPSGRPANYGQLVVYLS